jgi:hypothetical protein
LRIRIHNTAGRTNKSHDLTNTLTVLRWRTVCRPRGLAAAVEAGGAVFSPTITAPASRYTSSTGSDWKSKPFAYNITNTCGSLKHWYPTSFRLVSFYSVIDPRNFGADPYSCVSFSKILNEHPL